MGALTRYLTSPFIPMPSYHHLVATAASGDMDAANADDGDPSSSNWPRTDLALCQSPQLTTDTVVHDTGETTIFTILLSHLETVGLDLQSIVAISTDGAGVMIGTERGLVVRLRQRIPHLVGTHCIAH
ncbi:unnamed protein product, partial [Closterium sp. NIES-53]